MIRSEPPELAGLRRQLVQQWEGQPDADRRVDEAMAVVASWWSEGLAAKHREMAMWLTAHREISQRMRVQVAARRQIRESPVDLVGELELVKAELERVYEEMDRMLGWPDQA
jgi:hypothetical protein